MINDAYIVGYLTPDGELQHFKFDFHDLPLGSGIRAARCAEFDRLKEAFTGQGIKFGTWTLEDWARGWGRASLLRPKANFANGVG